MSDSSSDGNQVSSNKTTPMSNSAANDANDPFGDIGGQITDVMAKVNETLGKVDWSQMGKYGKALGIIAAVIVAQVIIKVVLDTINFFPVLPGLLELLGVIVLGQWSWQNLTTSEKRNAVFDRVQNLKKEYLG